MTDKEKILKYLVYKGISKNKFYQKTGLSIGFLDSGSSLGVDKLRVIHDNYHDLSIEWIVTGRGSMLKNQTNEYIEPNIISVVSEPKGAYAADKYVQQLEAENKRLIKQVSVLEQELVNKQHLIDAFTSGSIVAAAVQKGEKNAG